MKNELLVGKVSKILYVGNGNYTIASIKAQDHYFEVTIKGTMNIERDINYNFYGEFKEDDKYGEFFQVIKFETPKLESGDEIINFLSSKVFSGIGKRTATKIYKAFLDDTIDVIKNNPDALLDIGINETYVLELNSKISKNDLLKDLYEILSQFAYSDFLIQEIYKFLDENVTGNKIKIFLENPFEYISKIYMFNFHKADEVYLKYNGDPKNENRLLSLVEEIIIAKCYKVGDTKVSNEYVYNQLIKKINFEINFEDLINLGIKNKKIIVKDQFIQTSIFYHSERNIARNVSLRVNAIIQKLNPSLIDSNILTLESKFKINYSDTQKDAIKNALQNNISILTGGPGTGKTTIIRAIVHIFNDLKYKNANIKDISEKIMLCAPTGRASMRMKEATGFDAKTIHSLLGWDPYNNSFTRDIESPLSQELIVIDEFSMVDVFLANAIFRAIRPGSIILIVGDSAQLESVAPGMVLHDLLANEEISSVKLDRIYRQGSGSSIANLAHQIDYNKKIELINTTDMSVFNIDGSIVSAVKKIYERSLKVGYDILDVQVLYPKYKGINGIDNLNLALKPKLEKEYFEHNEITYQVGDKVMQLKNDNAREIYNGDIGTITKLYNYSASGKQLLIQIKIRNEFYDVSRTEMDEMTHAYAISVHKSQGSEFKIIILPITTEASAMLTKKLIYTAVTRSKDKLVILGDVSTFISGSSINDYKRKTFLEAYLNEEINKNEKSPLDFL